MCRNYGAIHGLLFDARDGKPVQGAAVVCVYYLEHGSVGGTLDEPVDASETKTDSAGRFLLPGKFVFAPRLPLSEFSRQPRIYIFAPGYESVALLGDQVYSRIDQKNVPLGTNDLGLSIYRTDARPILSVVTTDQTKVYEFRVSRLETDAQRLYHANTDFVQGPACKFPNYLKLFNSERVKYGLPEWHPAKTNKYEFVDKERKSARRHGP